MATGSLEPPPHQPRETCSSKPILAWPCSSPVCFAFEIAGSYSLCSYITNWNHVPFVRKPLALLAAFSCSKARNSRAMYTFLPTPPVLPPLKSGPLGDNNLTCEDANGTLYASRHPPHAPSHALRQLLVRVQVPVWTRDPEKDAPTTAAPVLPAPLSRGCFTRPHNKQNVAGEASEGESENSEEGGDACSPIFKEL